MVPPFFACKSLWPVSVRKARKMHVSVWIFSWNVFLQRKAELLKGRIFPILVKYNEKCFFYKLFFLSCSYCRFVISSK